MRIHYEIEKNQWELQKVIEKLKKNKNAVELAKTRSWCGSLPLHSTMIHGKEGVFELVKLLVDLYPEGVTETSDYGCLPIHYACGNTDDWVKGYDFLLKKHPEGAKVQNKSGLLPLHFAVYDESVVATKLLLQIYPEGVNAKNKSDQLPIDRAGNNEEIRELLVNASKSLENSTNENVTEECKEMKIKHEEKLDQYEVQPSNAKHGSKIKDESPIDEAGNRREILDLLMNAGNSRKKEPNSDGAGSCSTTTTEKLKIHLEIINNKNQLQKVVEKLKAHKHAPSFAKKKTIDGELPLHTAMWYGKEGVFELVEFLLELNPRGVNEKDGYGCLTIHCTTGETDDWKKAFSCLLEKYPEGAKVKDNDGWLPIHYAVWQKNVAATKLLLAIYPEGSKAKNNKGKLPIDKAGNHLEIRDLLMNASNSLEKEANINATVEYEVIQQKYEKIKQKYERKKQKLKRKKEHMKKLKVGYQENLKKLQEQLASANKILQCTRKLDTELIHKIIEKSEGWTTSELLTIAHSLNARLNALRAESGTRRSWAHENFASLLRQPSPSKEDLLESMEFLNPKLSKLEGVVHAANTREDAVNPASTSDSASFQTRPQKRARVEISP